MASLRHKVNICAPIINIGALRRMNSYEATGSFCSSTQALDDLICAHLDLVKELRRMDAFEETCIRLKVEGWSDTAIGDACGVTARSVRRWLNQIHWTIAA